MKVDVDTNIIVSGVFFGGNAFKILDAYTDDYFTLVTSPAILKEYTEVLFRLGGKKEKKLVEQWIALLVDGSGIISPQKRITVCRDPKDNKFLECLIEGKAKYLVSGDKDLLVLKETFKNRIVTPSEFLQAIS